MSRSAVDLMLDIIHENTPNDVWVGSVLASFKHLAGTNKGEIGEVFIDRFLTAQNIESKRAINRTHPWDMEIGGEKFEIKAASLGKNGTFQFNHIRLDRDYKYLLCLGVLPDSILTKFWRKGDVAEGKPGRLVRMAEGQAITFKLTLKSDKLTPIEDLPNEIRKELGIA